ncbi:hypothetical protein ABK040_010155 [Willaertia magna]
MEKRLSVTEETDDIITDDTSSSFSDNSEIDDERQLPVTPINQITIPILQTPNSINNNLITTSTTTNNNDLTSINSPPTKSEDTNSLPSSIPFNVNTTEYILLLFFHQFKEQASQVIDEFAFENKVNDNVILIVNSKLLNEAAPKSLANWNNSIHIGNNPYNEFLSSFSSSQPIMEFPKIDLSSVLESPRTNLAISPATSRIVNHPFESPISSLTKSPSSELLFSSISSEISTVSSFNNSGSSNSNEVKSKFPNQSFEQLLSAFATISKHHLNSLIEALIDWRKHLDCSPNKFIKERVKEKLVNLSKKATVTKQEALLSGFTERKELAADFVFCMTLLLVFGSVRHSELSLKNYEQIEELCLDRFKKAHTTTSGLESLSESRKKVLDLFAEILGVLTTKWFQKTTENILEQATSRLENKYESANFIRALKYVKIKLSKQQEVNESLNVLKRISDIIGTAKKSVIKRACAESITSMLSPLVDPEYKNSVDYKDWFSVLKNLLSISKKMCRKNLEYQLVAYPFRASVLCLNQKSTFITPFKEFFTDVIKLYKDKSTKLMSLDCLLHVLGYFLKIATDTDESTVIDTLTKTSSTIMNGKKVPPSPVLDNIYDATIDIIIMIATNRMEYGMNLVVKNLELDNSLSFLPETVYISLRSLTAIADLEDMKKIYSLYGDGKSEFPDWVNKLLERTQSRISSEATEGDDSEKDLASSMSVRMASPFSSYRSLTSGLASHSSSFANTILNKDQKLWEGLGIHRFQSQLSDRLSVILRYSSQVYGNFLQTNQVKALHENLSKDKYYSLRVVVSAISLVPRILPSDLTKKELCDILCKFLIHQYGDLRDVSWDTMIRLMDFHSNLRPVLIQSFAEMIMGLDDFRFDLLKAVLKKFISLLELWICNLTSPNLQVFAHVKLPTVYGNLKPESSVGVYFDPSPIEAVGVVLLCNINPSIRVFGLKTFMSVKKILTTLCEKDNKEPPSTVADLLEESGMRYIQAIWKEDSIPDSLEKFITNPSVAVYDYLTDFLRYLGKDLSIFCVPTSQIALIHIIKRISRLNNLLDSKVAVTSEVQRIVELWSHFINLACSMGRRPLFDQEDDSTSRNTILRTPRITSAKQLYEMIFPYLKSNYDKQATAAVSALGSVPDELLEIMLDSIKIIENEAYAADKQRKNRKRKDLLRVQLARVYSRLSSNIHDTTMKEKEFVKEKFLCFIEEQIQYSKIPGNMYSIDLQSLRHHLFIVIENVSRKLYYFPPKPGYRTFDKSFRKELLLFVIQWTGYGKASSKREEEELASLTSTLEKLKDSEEKRNMGNVFRRKSSRMKEKSCAAVASLLLGEFFENNIDSLKNWSSSTRMENKKNFRANTNYESDEFEDASQDELTTLIYKEGRSSSRSSFSNFSLLDNVLLRGNSGSNVNLKEMISAFDDEPLGITIFKWIDEILCSKYETYRGRGIETIENILESNPSLLDICIDQCYNCGKRISKGYFVAICNVFERCEMVCSIPVLLTLILYKSVSEKLSNRNNSYKLLGFISQRFFASDVESGNYPYFISSGLSDQYCSRQILLAQKLSRDHPQYAYGVLEEVYKRLAYLSSTDQRGLLNTLIAWIPYLNLDEEAIKAFRVDDEQRTTSESKRILDILFEITKTYSLDFPKECEEMWMKLSSSDSTNFRKIIIYLTERGVHFVADQTHYRTMFGISQKIAYYCACAGPQQVVDSLIEFIQKARDDPPVVGHLRDSIPSMMEYTPISNQTLPARSDIVLILLSEVAYAHPQVFAKHLPLLLQYMFIRMDHKIRTVSYNAKLLLVHLIHTFVVNQLPHNGGTIEQNQQLSDAKELILFLTECKMDQYLWIRDNITIDEASLRHISTSAVNTFFNEDTDNDNESNADDTEVEMLGETMNGSILSDNFNNNSTVSINVKQMTSLVKRVVNIFKNEENIKEMWGYEALLWATKSYSIHNVVRSYQIYRTLRPELRQSDLISILQDFTKYLDDLLISDSLATKSSPSTDKTTKIAVVVEIIDTIRVVVKHMDKQRLTMFPQLFWLATSILHTDVIHIYVHGLRLLITLLKRLDIGDETVRNILIASRTEALAPTVTDVQELILKGLSNEYSESLAVQLLAHFCKVNCEFLCEFDSGNKFIMRNIIGLLPLFCIHINDEKRFKCMKIAADIVNTSEGTFKRISKVFSRYSKGYYDSPDKFLLDFRKPFCEAFFPKFEKYIFDFCIDLLQCGPKCYQKSLLSILHSLLLYANSQKTNIGKKDGFIATTISMVKESVWLEATKVLDVTLKNCIDKRSKESIQLKHYHKSVTEALTCRTSPCLTSKYTLSEKAGPGTKQCISTIQSIHKYTTQPIKEKDINLLDLLDEIHYAPETPHNVVATTIVVEPTPTLGVSAHDIDQLEFDLSGDDSITEDSVLSTEYFDGEATEVDLLTSATSKYRFNYDFEQNQEEEDTKRLEEQLQTIMQKVLYTEPPLPSNIPLNINNNNDSNSNTPPPSPHNNGIANNNNGLNNSSFNIRLKTSTSSSTLLNGIGGSSNDLSGPKSMNRRFTVNPNN